LFVQMVIKTSQAKLQYAELPFNSINFSFYVIQYFIRNNKLTLLPKTRTNSSTSLIKSLIRMIFNKYQK
jgi:hypothetical protein